MRKFHAIFKGLEGGHDLQLAYPGVKIKYPQFLYLDGANPVKVHSTDEEEGARALGYDSITAGAMSNPYLINWFWDFEDMSVKQLHVFAKEEYGVDLPIEAGQEKLFSAVVDLTRNAPQNRNRLVLMAHTVAMNYDATLEEIKRMVNGPTFGAETHTESYEFEA